MKNHSRSGGEHIRLLLAGILLYGVVLPLHAGEFAYGLGYTATHSSNIARVPTGESSDWIHSLLGGFTYVENTTDVVANVLAQAEYQDYQKGTFGNETLFNLNSSVLWNISPQQFTWTLQDTYQQDLIDSTGVATPANRTNVNVLSTGPDFYLRFSPVQTLALGFRAADAYTSRVDVDNKRFTGTAGWLYQSSSITTYSLNYQAMGVKYDNSTINDNFTRQDAFVRAQVRPSRSQFMLDLGSTRINRDRESDLSGSLARLTWYRQLTPESVFGADVSREFSDTGTDILTASTTTGSPLATTPGQPVTATGLSSTTPQDLSPNTITSDVYYDKRGEIFYTRRGTQSGVQFQVYHRNINFETLTLDRRETGGNLQLDYYYSSNSTISVYTETIKTKYLDFFRNDTDRNTGLRFGYRLTHTISLGAEGSHTSRNSTMPSEVFVDNRVMFSILYSSAPLFTPMLGR